MLADEQDKLLMGHDADGIQELDNDLPLWWFVMFVITVTFGVCYLVNYHVAWGGSSKLEYEQEVADWKRATGQETEVAAENLPPIEPLTDFASLDKGRQIFVGTTNNCANCHRPDLGGNIGPNLTDDHWVHGCDLRTIMKNIATGFPSKGMQKYGTGARLSDRQLLEVASYILSKRGSNPPNPKAIDTEREVPCNPDQAPAAEAANKEAGKATDKPAEPTAGKASDKSAKPEPATKTESNPVEKKAKA